MKKPELLAPIQDFTSLKAAVTAGADAVYFGIRGFNMRAGAKNFTIKDIGKITKFCREHSVKSYLALNTIIYQKELKTVEKILVQAKKSGVNAVICFDLSVLNLAKKAGLEIHLSTQAGVSNAESALFYSNLGVTRIVLARECSLKDIQEIKKVLKQKKKKTEIEVFVHGAMCVSISGRCFLSEHLYGASANRGACSQPCRRKYLIKQIDGEKELELGEDYVLSPKDLCALPFLPKLLEAGVDCLKIEGRNRSPEYVFITTQIYREAIDYYFLNYKKRGFVKDYLKKKDEWLKELKKVYNRGFSDGFYLGRPLNQWTHNYGSEATRKKIHLGKVIKYYPKIKVAEIKIEANKSLKLKDEISIEGEKTGLVLESVTSLQKNHQNIKIASQGEAVAFTVKSPVKKGDVVYKFFSKKV